MDDDLEHDAVRRNRLTVESCSRFKKLERVRTAKGVIYELDPGPINA
jgi:hypothetical protein